MSVLVFQSGSQFTGKSVTAITEPSPQLHADEASGDPTTYPVVLPTPQPSLGTMQPPFHRTRISYRATAGLDCAMAAWHGPVGDMAATTTGDAALVYSLPYKGPEGTTCGVTLLDERSY